MVLIWKIFIFIWKTLDWIFNHIFNYWNLDKQIMYYLFFTSKLNHDHKFNSICECFYWYFSISKPALFVNAFIIIFLFKLIKIKLL
jgi:hypothetical protein